VEINTIDYAIFGVPIYIFCFCVAFVIAVCLFIILLSQKHIEIALPTKYLLCSMVALVLSARLFGILSGIYGAIGRSEKITWETIRQTGIVFYGGLIGLLLSYYFMTYKSSDLRIRQSINTLAVVIPLFHSISRVGCFLGGCCYGASCNSKLSVKYTTEISGAIDTTYRIPIQLLEAALNFLIFLYLLRLYKRNDWEARYILRKYLVLYSVLRFTLEFWRGDEIRGVVYGISFSQMISLLIWIFYIIHRIRNSKKKEKYSYESS